MNENALCVEMGIPLLAHPKHTYAKIGGLTDSESEYSSNSEAELDDLIQYSKQVESNSTKNSKSYLDSLPTWSYMPCRKDRQCAWRRHTLSLSRLLALSQLISRSRKAP